MNKLISLFCVPLKAKQFLCEIFLFCRKKDIWDVKIVHPVYVCVSLLLLPLSLSFIHYASLYVDGPSCVVVLLPAHVKSWVMSWTDHLDIRRERPDRAPSADEGNRCRRNRRDFSCYLIPAESVLRSILRNWTDWWVGPRVATGSSSLCT